MATFSVSWTTTREPEEVQADEWEDKGDWIDFVRIRGPRGSGQRIHVLRVRADDVHRIDRVKD